MHNCISEMAAFHSSPMLLRRSNFVRGDERALNACKFVPCPSCRHASRAHIGRPTGVAGLRASRASRRTHDKSDDDAFATCANCGSDELISATEIRERGILSVKCSQCRAQFSATFEEALTGTGTLLSEGTQGAVEEAEEEDPSNAEIKLYFGGLPPKVGNDALRRAVEEFGVVTKTAVIYDRATGLSRGFGFVTVRGKSTAAAVVDVLDGDARRLGRRLTVREATE